MEQEKKPGTKKIKDGFRVTVDNDGKIESVDIVDDGEGFKAIYNGMEFTLNEGHSIHRGGMGRDYHDEIIYMMYQPKDDIPRFAGWWCGSPMLEDGDEIVLANIAWEILDFVGNGKKYKHHGHEIDA